MTLNPTVGQAWKDFVMSDPDGAAIHLANHLNRSKRRRTTEDFNLRFTSDRIAFLIANPPETDSESDEERHRDRPPCFGREHDLVAPQLVIHTEPLRMERAYLVKSDTGEGPIPAPGSPRLSNFCFSLLPLGRWRMRQSN